MTISTHGYAYFIRREDDEGPVKIGWTGNPPERLYVMMCWSPYRLKIAALVPGTRDLEPRFHGMFRAHHSHSEWFHPSLEIDAMIARINSGQFNVCELPAPRHLKAGLPGKKWTPERRAAVVSERAARAAWLAAKVAGADA